MFKLGPKSIEQLQGLHPELVAVVLRAIQLTRQDFRVADGARSAEEQHALFKRGASQKDGYRNKSNHQHAADGTGHAVDLIPYGADPEDWDNYYPIAVAMSLAARELHTKIRWGGNWYEAMHEYPADLVGVKAAVERYKKQHPGPDFIDGPHFEIVT